ncbi:MAG: TRCF domain-containing protein, partial [Bdellovibrionales bacterium]
SLGAGFQLASHDMDIRGAGNLVGEEQSGHIKEVGVELYQQMLEDAVAATRAGVDMNDLSGDHDWSPNINLGMSILIPETYVSDLSVRMGLYRRLPDLEDSQAIEAFAVEMIDRFGALPEEVHNLLEITKIKQLCKKAGIDRVDAGPKGAIIGFYKDTPVDPDKVIQWVASQKGTVKPRPDQRLSIVRNWENPKQRVKGVWNIVKQLV